MLGVVRDGDLDVMSSHEQLEQSRSGDEQMKEAELDRSIEIEEATVH